MVFLNANSLVMEYKDMQEVQVLISADKSQPRLVLLYEFLHPKQVTKVDIFLKSKDFRSEMDD